MARFMTTSSLHPPLAEIDDPHESSGWRATRFDHEETLHTEMLRELCDRSCPLHLGAARSRGVAATLQLVDVMQQQLVILCVADGIAVARALQARPPWAAAHLHSLRVQFALAAAHATREGTGERTSVDTGEDGGGRERFLIHARWPREIYRSPRRRSERLASTPQLAPVARFHHGSRLVSARDHAVMNISEHGCAVLLPAALPPPAPGTTLRQVELELDDDHVIFTDATVQHVTPARRGAHEIGCRWESMPRTGQQMLRRWLARAAQGASVAHDVEADLVD